jgi:hypothetical protein
MQFAFAQKQEKAVLSQPKSVDIKEVKVFEKEGVHYKTENNTPQNQPIQLSSKKTPVEEKSVSQKEVKPFEPIPANEYTDKNYHVNLKKSQDTQKALDATPINTSESKSISAEEQVEIYKEAQKKYDVNSVEYKQIQQKIEKLTF